MTQVIGKMKLLKWWMPLLLVAALVAAGGLAWSQSGSGGSFDTSSLPQITDINPAYDDQIVVPGEAAPIALWTVTMDPPTSLIMLGGGDMTTVTVTNNIPAPLNNGTGIGRYGPFPGAPEKIMDNGDLTGDLLITADVYNVIDPDGCIAVFPTMMTQHDVIVKVYDNITVHPAGTVTFTCPVLPGLQAIPGGEYMLKAQFVNVRGLSTPLNVSDLYVNSLVTSPAPPVTPIGIASVYPGYISVTALSATPSASGMLIKIIGAGFGTSGATTVTITNTLTTVSFVLALAPSINGGVASVTPTVVTVYLLPTSTISAGTYDVTVNTGTETTTISQGLVVTP